MWLAAFTFVRPAFSVVYAPALLLSNIESVSRGGEVVIYAQLSEV